MIRLLPLLLTGCAETFIEHARHSVEGYMPRVHCVRLDVGIIERLAAGGSLAFVGFVLICLTLIRAVIRNRSIVSSSRLSMTVAAGMICFFALCGLGHGIDVAVLARPEFYEHLSWVTTGTGVAAIVVAAALPWLLRHVYRVLRERDEEARERKTAEEQVQDLHARVERLSEMTTQQVQTAEANLVERMANLRRLAMDSEREWLQGERAQAFVDAIPSPVCVVDQDGLVFALVNQTFARALGREPAEMNGQRWQLFMHSDDIARIDAERREHQEALNRGESGTGSFTTRYLHLDGSAVLFHWTPGPMAGAEPAYYIAEG